MGHEETTHNTLETMTLIFFVVAGTHWRWLAIGFDFFVVVR
jgi:hypothetical protein